MSMPSAGVVTGFSELTLEARDPARLARFYQEAFGLELIASGDDRVWLAAGARARLGLWDPGPKEFGDEGGVHVHFAFRSRPARSRRWRHVSASSACPSRAPSPTTAATAPCT